MKTVLLALLEQYADWEAAYVSTAVHMLGQGKFVVKTVSLSKEPVTSIGGIRVVPDYTVGSASKDYDALLLIGGLCWREERAQQMIPLVEHCVNSGKVLGGICDAAAFLASIGVLDSVKHTGNRSAPLEFAREVLTALHVAEEAMIEDWYVLHKLGYYNTSSHNHFVKMMEE